MIFKIINYKTIISLISTINLEKLKKLTKNKNIVQTMYNLATEAEQAVVNNFRKNNGLR